ncbi:MAG: branched-chain amino acid aminotransferase [Clostridiales bacterium]|nr:branched-chain amino acid aminotransferase [Clostridiales bacterium]
MLDISITKTTSPKAKPDESNLGFGKYFTDHMFITDYTAEKGWHDARIVPFGNLDIHPASTVLHYGAEVFEGMKAYRTEKGVVQMFRPLENVKRMNMSAERLCLPQLDEEFGLKALHEFVKLEKDWVPRQKGTSLYLRPFLFGNDPLLGLRTIDRAMFVIIASPVGNYYAEGINPVKITVETKDVRAVRGGTGYAKCGGNYAASNRAATKASEKGFSQVLWLDGVERKYVEEVGSMNVMFMIDGKVYTPKLTGSVLPGITRKSIIEVLKDWNYEVIEKEISIDELAEAVKEGRLQEAWGTGTAAVISPIGLLNYQGVDYIINNNEIGELTAKLYDELTGIQAGLKEDKFNWCYKVD